MLFERKKYLDRLVAGRGNGMIKIVTGVRRCGKSYLLFNIFSRWLKNNGVAEDHIVGLSLDDFKNRKLRNPDALIDFIEKKIKTASGFEIQDVSDEYAGKFYVILDEIQLVENFVEVMLSLMHIPNVEVYVSGSNSRFLSSDVVTEFRGRGQEIRVRPLSVEEFLMGTRKDFRIGLHEYFVYGGLPQVALLESEEDKVNFLSEMYEVTYLRDVVERNHLRNADGMRELVRVLASGIGASCNPKRIADTFKTVAKMKISDQTIKDYIGHLKDAFLISEALRYDLKGRKYIGTEMKYYFEDMGLRNVVLGFRQVEETHIMENVIYNELKTRGYLVDVGLVEVWGRDIEGKSIRKNLEVDFVVNKGSQRYYIQSAYALPTHDKVDQEERSLVNIGDSFKKIVIVYDDIILKRSESGVVTMSLREFLMDPKSLEK